MIVVIDTEKESTEHNKWNGDNKRGAENLQ
jgi:hypothetical protein